VCACVSRGIPPTSRDLAYTNLRGTIPTELGQLSALTRLNLNALGLQGTFPSFVTCRLTSLYVHSMTRYDQSLSLTHSCTIFLSRLAHASKLAFNEPRDVEDNALASISSLKNCESLTLILARNNSLQTLPLVYGSVTQLYFSSNRISTIPSEFFAQLWNLYTIDLSNNSLTSLPDSYVTTSRRIASHRTARSGALTCNLTRLDDDISMPIR